MQSRVVAFWMTDRYESVVVHLDIKGLYKGEGSSFYLVQSRFSRFPLFPLIMASSLRDALRKVKQTMLRPCGSPSHEEEADVWISSVSKDDGKSPLCSRWKALAIGSAPREAVESQRSRSFKGKPSMSKDDDKFYLHSREKVSSMVSVSREVADGQKDRSAEGTLFVPNTDLGEGVFKIGEDHEVQRLEKDIPEYCSYSQKRARVIFLLLLRGFD